MLAGPFRLSCRAATHRIGFRLQTCALQEKVYAFHVACDGLVLLRAPPLEFLGHERADHWGRFDCVPPGVVLKPDTPRDHVLDGGSKLLAYGVDDLGLDLRAPGNQRLGQAGICPSELQDVPRSCSEFLRQVMRGFFRKRIDANQLLPEVARESFSAMKNVRSCRRFADRNSQSFLNRIDRVFRHLAVCRPLASHNADDAALRIDLNNVVAPTLFLPLSLSPLPTA